MARNTIQNLVDQIWSPDIEIIIPKKWNQTLKARQQFVKISLCNLAPQMYQSNKRTPFVQIKDKAGQLVFNDTLHIHSSDALHTYIKNKKEINVDFVFNTDQDDQVFCILSTFLNGIEYRHATSTLQLQVPRPLLTLENYTQMMKFMVGNLIKSNKMPKELIKPQLQIDFLNHTYSPKTQQWEILVPQEKP